MSRPWTRRGDCDPVARYFQPDCLSQSRRAAGCIFSHWVMERVSFVSIFSFIQMQ